MNSIPVSVCIIAKDEEENITRCLESIKKSGFEIVVTDTGSTDSTKQIAKRYTDKVYDLKWTDNFSDARNFCASKASNDWILALDCDEEIDSIDIECLRKLIEKYPQAVGMLNIRNITNSCGGEKGYVTDEVARLYNRKYYMFCNPVHEQICSVRQKEKTSEINSFCIPAYIWHHGYALTGEKMITKQHRNLRLLYKNLEKEPNNPYIYFQIGQSEAIIGEYEKAVIAYEKGLSLNDDTDYFYVQLMLISLSRVFMKMENKNAAVNVLDRYLTANSSARYMAAYAEALWNNDNRMKAVVLYMKVTLMPEADTLGDELLKCYAHIIQWYVDTGNQEMADLYKEKFAVYKDKQDRLVS